MPRFRTTAIVAVAASALIATSGAAYARDLHLKKVAREASAAPSMSWAYYHGDLTDISKPILNAPDFFKGGRATAIMMGINGETTFRVTLKGLAKDAIGHNYGAHLHLGSCGLDGNDQPTVGLHYNTDVLANKTNPLVSATTEVWLNFHVNSGGNAHATTTVPFVPSGPVRSITFHAKPTTQDGSDAGKAGDKLACLPLDIKTLTSSG